MQNGIIHSSVIHVWLESQFILLLTLLMAPFSSGQEQGCHPLCLSTWSVIANLCSTFVKHFLVFRVKRLVVIVSSFFWCSSSLVQNVLPVGYRLSRVGQSASKQWLFSSRRKPPMVVETLKWVEQYCWLCNYDFFWIIYFQLDEHE